MTSARPQVFVSVALGDMGERGWAPRLAALRQLGVDGLDVDVVWRRHAPSEHRVDFSGALDVAGLAQAAAAEGLPVRWHLGPRCDHRQPSVGVPEFVLADEPCWARGPHGGPVWLPLVPRVVPMLALDGERLRAAVEVWIAQAAGALAPYLGPEDRLIGEWPDDGAQRLRDAAFAFDYHPDAITAFARATGAAAPPPTCWPDHGAPAAARGEALAWLRFVEQRAARLGAFVDERLAIEFGHRGRVRVMPRGAAAAIGAHAIDPPLLLPIDPQRDLAAEAEAFVRGALERGAPEVRLRLPGDAPATAMSWLPRVRAQAAAHAADPRSPAAGVPKIAVISTAADRRIALASSVLPGLPPQAIAWAAPGVDAAMLLSGDARARRSVAWIGATERGLAAGGLRADSLLADVTDEVLTTYPVVVVPTSARIERDLWARLCALAAARTVVVVVGDELPTDDEYDQPLPPELRSPRRIGRMQPAALHDAALLGGDLAALVP